LISTFLFLSTVYLVQGRRHYLVENLSSP
jgi:hypothetical protein